MSRVYLKVELNARYQDDSPQGLGVTYLNSGEMDLRQGVGLAVATLFSPLGAIQSGATPEEVERQIAYAERVFQNHMSLARSQVSPNRAIALQQSDQEKCSVAIPESDNTVEPVVASNETEYADDNEEL